MALDADDTIQLIYPATGETVRNIITYSYEQNWIGGTSDTLTATLYSEDFENLIRWSTPGTQIEFAINKQTQMLGTVLVQEFSDDTTVSITAYDYRHKLRTAYIDAPKFNTGDPLDKTILNALQPLGITEIDPNGYNSYRNQAIGTALFTTAPRLNPALQTVTTKDKSSEPESPYGYCMRHLERAGLLLQVSTKRNAICLVEPEYRQGPSYLLRRDGTAGNILSGTLTRDFSEFPTYILATGRTMTDQRGQKRSPMRFELDPFNEPISKIDVVGGILDSHFFRGRLLATDPVSPDNGGLYYAPRYIESKDSKTQLELEKLVRREFAASVAQTLQVEYTVKGHSDRDGRIYCVDTIAEIDDRVFRVQDHLYVAARRMSWSNGPTTSLTLIHPDSFQL